MLGGTIRARVKGGVLEPLEPLELAEGDEVTLTITLVASSRPRGEWLTRTAGGWAGLVDGERLKREISERRSLMTRPEPRL